LKKKEKTIKQTSNIISVIQYFETTTKTNIALAFSKINLKYSEVKGVEDYTCLKTTIIWKVEGVGNWAMPAFFLFTPQHIRISYSHFLE